MQPLCGLAFDFSLTIALTCLFLTGTAFYIFRLGNPHLLRKANGYFDWENELWHAVCLLGMAACLAPVLLPIPIVIWSVLFPIGTAWYLVRAFTYGLKLPYNKQWYDLAHAAMLFGMWWMFVEPAKHFFITLAFAGYWGWFGSYYLKRLIDDYKKPQGLSIGQDLFHFAMAAVMLLMTISPATFMPEHNHSNSIGHQNPLKLSPEVLSVDDGTFETTVMRSPHTVVLLVFGGCEKCASEISVFEAVAKELRPALGSTDFACLHKDDCPNSCAKLGVNQCPVLLIISNQQVVASTDKLVSAEEMKTFIRSHLKH